MGPADVGVQVGSRLVFRAHEYFERMVCEPRRTIPSCATLGSHTNSEPETFPTYVPHDRRPK